jgi:hypothetical protein
MERAASQQQVSRGAVKMGRQRWHVCRMGATEKLDDGGTS